MTNEKIEKVVIRCLIFYVASAVIAFGPATVQSENNRDLHVAACKVEHKPGTSDLAICIAMGPHMQDGLSKAIFWPFWISYTIARNI